MAIMRFRTGLLNQPRCSGIVHGSEHEVEIACHKVALSAEAARNLTLPFRKIQQSAEQMTVTSFLTDILVLSADKSKGVVQSLCYCSEV